MSRKFSKVMIICAMVVLFPLLIVGTAFASYYSISAIVEVDTYVNYSNVAADANAFAEVLYKKQSEKSFTIEESHMNTLSLKAAANGYNFQGWFNGNQTQYAETLASGDDVEFVSTFSQINVDIKKYDALLAVFNVKEYDVTYKYKAQPNDAQEVVETRHYFYGDALIPDLTYAGVGYNFTGWQIEGDAQTYTTANFAKEGAVTLVGSWVKQEQVDVNYFAEDKSTLLKSTKIYQNQEYTLDTIDAVFAQANKTKVAGYKYSWVDESGKTVTTINRKSAMNIYASKETIVYNLKLKTGDANFAGNATTKVTVVDATGLTDWLNANKWSTDYSFHKFAGLRFDGETYSAASAAATLRNKIIEKNPNGSSKTIEVEAVVARNFATVSIAQGISFKAAGASSIYNKDVYTAADLGKFAYSLPAYDVDSSETVYEMLNMKMSDGSVLALFTADGKEVKLASLKITINGKTLPSITVTGEETLNQVIEMLLAKVEMEDAAIFEITSITANFNVIA